MESTSRVEKFDGHIMRFRKSDAFINITTLCQGFPDKRPQEFLRLESLQPIIAELGKSNESQTLIYNVRGRYGGTWVHPTIGVECARWLCPPMAVACNKVVSQLMAGEKRLVDTAPEPAAAPLTPMNFGNMTRTQWIALALKTSEELDAANEVIEEVTAQCHILTDKVTKNHQINTDLHRALEETVPRVEFHEAVAQRSDEMDMSAVAGTVGIGRDLLLRLLHETKDFIYWHKALVYRPNSEHIRLKRFRLCETPFDNP